ncbi:MAG: heparinase II/III family protein, partial [Armatimonadetes bacterium]|nr:heparinase II/III family protein [Armatimonadota bacterium]
SDPNGTSARITSVDAGDKVLSSDYRLCEPGTHDWRRYEWLVSLPLGAVRFNLVLFHHGGGSAWWDDVSLLRATPLAALAPADGAGIADGRPELRWEPTEGDATVELSPDATFSTGVLGYPATGAAFRPPEPLAGGREWCWRVLVRRPDDSLAVVCRPPQADRPAVWARIYAGSWEQRMQPLAERLNGWRARLAELQALADRNGMWDRFTLLADAVAAGDRLLAAEPADPTAALAAFEAQTQAVGLYLPWWERLFLGDTDLFAGLDLDRPGLAAVKAAAAREDWPAARLALREYYRRRRLPTWYGKHLDPPKPNPERKQPAADQLLTHRMAIQNWQEPTFDLGPGLDWHVLPTEDIEWPTKLNRCFHWSTLARAWRETGRAPYAQEIQRQLLDFAQDNPMEGWDWRNKRFAWSTLNATVRIYSSWLDSFLQVRDAPAWTPDAQFVYLAELREHGRFLMTHHANQGNWVVAEARGLVELGVVFPEFREAPEWLAEGLRRLAREVDIQVLADGVHVERTPGYHGMTLSCFMDPLRLALLNDAPVAARDHFLAKLEAMHDYYLYGQKPNHRMEQIGDSGRMSADGYVQQGWDLFRREDMNWVRTNGAVGRPPVELSHAFAAAGQYISRSAWNDPQALWSLLDWGGFLGHCHEDMGQLSLYAYGGDLLIDTGIYSYAWPSRAPFYQTVGHNTVMVDQTTQKRRDPLEAHWSSTPAMDVFWGLTDNSEPLRHARTMAFRQPGATGPGYWLVVDHLTGAGQHRLDQRWHANDLLAAHAEGSTVVLAGKPGGAPQPSLVLASLPQDGLGTTVEPGFTSYGWYEKTAVDVAQFSLQVEPPATFVTVLYPTPADAAPATITIEPLPATRSDATAVSVTIRDRGAAYRDRWLVRHRAAGTVAAGGVETDARVAYVREGGAQWHLAWGARLAIDGTERFHGDAAVDGAALTPGRPVVTTPVTVPAPPKAPGGPRFELELPPEPPRASTTAAVVAQPGEPIVRAEAEAFSAQGGGQVELTDKKVGATGQSFLHWDLAGHWLEWVLEVPRAGRYRLHLRACTAEDEAVRKLTVDGRVPPGGEAVALPGTGGYSNERDDWAVLEVPLDLELPAAKLTVRLENVDGRSLNVDWVGLAAP